MQIVLYAHIYSIYNSIHFYMCVYTPIPMIEDRNLYVPPTTMH